MNHECLSAILNGFAVVSQRLAHQLKTPSVKDDFYGEMCFAYVRRNGSLTDKSLAYTIKVCKNEALNSFFKGKSICSKPRKGLNLISYESLAETIPTKTNLEKHVFDRVLVDRVLSVLTGRERQVAELVMQGYTLTEIARELSISNARVSRIKRQIRMKYGHRNRQTFTDLYKGC